VILSEDQNNTSQVLRIKDVNGAPVEVFTNHQLSPTNQEMECLQRIAKSNDVVKVIGLPDLHLKPKLEAPSSIVTATRNNLVPGYTSPSPNCGMAIMTTSLVKQDLDVSCIDTFVKDLSTRLDIHQRAPLLEPHELDEILLRGTKSIVERYKLHPRLTEHVDEWGDAFLGTSEPDEVLASIPSEARKVGSVEFGSIGRGNHFIELQYVESISDAEVAEQWAIKPGQILIMLHVDSGRFGAILGRLFSYRQKNTLTGRIYLSRMKMPYIVQNGKFSRLPQRIYYHLWPRRFAAVPFDNEEGQRTLKNFRFAANYAYANRVLVFELIRQTFRKIWGESVELPHLLWDAPHNSIRSEQHGGETLWVHRHNAARALPVSKLPSDSFFKPTGQPVLLPGLDRTHSFLCAAGEGISKTLNSVCHGAGSSISRISEQTDQNSWVRLYDMKHGLKGTAPKMSDEGLTEVLSVLHKFDLAQPVVKLRPLAVLKDSV
jgi:RNA-splicing ligase RtcB